MYKKILLPTDGSKNSKRANKHAIWVSNISGAEIVVLHVIEPYYPRATLLPISTLPVPDENFYDELKEEGKIIVEDFKEELKENQCKHKCENVKLTTQIKEGKPYLEILKTIAEEDVDLVVMGASGRHGLDRFMLGSVTERVVRTSKKPVMIIP
jgi:nucleotide-binding universal stress UspA family protein